MHMRVCVCVCVCVCVLFWADTYMYLLLTGKMQLCMRGKQLCLLCFISDTTLFLLCDCQKEILKQHACLA